jgi:hypothetical protein
MGASYIMVEITITTNPRISMVTRLERTPSRTRISTAIPYSTKSIATIASSTPTTPIAVV